MMSFLKWLFCIALLTGGCTQETHNNPETAHLPVREVSARMDTTFSALASELKSDHIPDSVFDMIHLKHLDITGMDCDYRIRDKDGNDITECWGISEIPARIANLQELETLSLNVNAIPSIPEELIQLKHLRVLVLDDNTIFTDGANLDKLENLEVLSLNGCKISKLPDGIGQLKKLRSLGLAETQLDAKEKARIKKALPGCNILF